MRFMLVTLAVLMGFSVSGQNAFDYEVTLDAISIPGLTGLHSYAVAEHEGKWLFVGGRRDGLHARQPFSAFPENLNNTMLLVVDPQTALWWEADMSSLPVSIREQLQSTNSCFTHHGDSLFLVGGYAYAPSAGDHVTFPQLTVFHVAEVIAGVISGSVDPASFRSLSDERFAVTGGRLAYDGERFLVVGGHRFDGSYNPMGMPTYTQAYTNAIRRFKIDQSEGGLSLNDYAEIVDEVHLHRRDYNLVPWRYADGHETQLISSGVFQPTADLPFLYPVEIDGSQVIPHTAFNQYLSNYHCPTVSLFDGAQTHAIFFGGMSRYYYSNGSLVEDALVPFTRTISRITKSSDGAFEEAVFATEMPGLKGSGAELLVNPALPVSESGVVMLNEIPLDTIDLGYIYGGISSTQLNPFNSNQTGNTSADATWYRVRLVSGALSVPEVVPGNHEMGFTLFPNPASEVIHLRANRDFNHAEYFLLDAQGKMVGQGELAQTARSETGFEIEVSDNWAGKSLNMVVVFDYIYTSSQMFCVR